MFFSTILCWIAEKLNALLILIQINNFIQGKTLKSILIKFLSELFYAF